MGVTQERFLGNIAVLPQETILKKENIKKEKGIFDFLSRKEFVELLKKHPKATDEELMHMVIASKMNQTQPQENEPTQINQDGKQGD